MMVNHRFPSPNGRLAVETAATIQNPTCVGLKRKPIPICEPISFLKPHEGEVLDGSRGFIRQAISDRLPRLRDPFFNVHPPPGCQPGQVRYISKVILTEEGIPNQI